MLIFGDISKRDENQLFILFLTFLVFFFSLTILQSNKSQAYHSYQQIEFEHVNTRLFANLYHPSKDIEFQDKKPLIIYVHGLGNDRNFDLHFPIELVKRGFFVATLDYHGHGQSGGTMFDLNPDTGNLAIYEDVSKLLDKIETLPIYSSSINSSQIGLVGHSLGGAIVLMTSILDDRINTTVALAPLVSHNVLYHPHFENNLPVDYLNKSNTQNLLLMAHKDDGLLDYRKHAVVAYNLTNSTLSLYEGPMIGGAHLMINSNIITDMISWIEINFFGFVNGPITISFMFNYALLGISFSLLFGIIFLIISLSSNFFSFETIKIERIALRYKENYSTKDKVLRLSWILLACITFIGIWTFFSNVFRLAGIFYGSFALLVIYSVLYLALHFKNRASEDTLEFGLKHKLKSRLTQELKTNYIMYGILASGIFQGFYVVFTVSYPFAFVWPSNLQSIIMGFTIIPIFLAMELFYRSIIYPLLNFIDSERTKTKIIIALSILIQISIIYFNRIWVFLPSLLMTYLAFISVLILNTLIYEKNKAMTIRLIFSVDILFFFFGSAITNIFGIDIAIYALL
jgi:pimeloyl-ACP methyl ester carboxylesterase